LEYLLTFLFKAVLDVSLSTVRQGSYDADGIHQPTRLAVLHPASRTSVFRICLSFRHFLHSMRL
jgi:hypothetical protein